MINFKIFAPEINITSLGLNLIDYSVSSLTNDFLSSIIECENAHMCPNEPKKLYQKEPISYFNSFMK